MLKVKRVYDKKESGDGRRILVDRLWPRGIAKEEAGIDEWVKELAPGTGLRKWFMALKIPNIIMPGYLKNSLTG
jgi:uncharacterized protein YeaO (DUF488 family)